MQMTDFPLHYLKKSVKRIESNESIYQCSHRTLKIHILFCFNDSNISYRLQDHYTMHQIGNDLYRRKHHYEQYTNYSRSYRQIKHHFK